MDHSDASGSSTFFLFLYLFFLMKDYGSIVNFPTFIVYFVSLVLSASPFSSKLVLFLIAGLESFGLFSFLFIGAHIKWSDIKESSMVKSQLKLI